ncbi:MAG TPA: hypothetical protein PKA82_09790 [Pyrinomonadaceae bacterium]|nr:hypothetical protein [Pyrinomonadaceae bacterium]
MSGIRNITRTIKMTVVTREMTIRQQSEMSFANDKATETRLEELPKRAESIQRRISEAISKKENENE